jgi:hypothetical protein
MAAAGLLLVVPGCGGRGVTEIKQQGEAGENLNVIARAYNAATEKNNHPPANVEELNPFLPPGVDQDSLFRSPRDGQPFVILWGTDARTGMDVRPLVIGYEKRGSGGDRFVFTAMGVMQMTGEDFAKARFPEGHQP